MEASQASKIAIQEMLKRYWTPAEMATERFRERTKDTPRSMVSDYVGQSMRANKRNATGLCCRQITEAVRPPTPLPLRQLTRLERSSRKRTSGLPPPPPRTPASASSRRTLK